MIVTVKFVGATNYGILEQFKSMLAGEADDFIIRKLLENKNEVTIKASKDTTSDIHGPTTAMDVVT